MPYAAGNDRVIVQHIYDFPDVMSVYSGQPLDVHRVCIHRLGAPQQSRDAFSLLAEAALLDAELCDRLKAMVGFFNVAVHDYRKLNLAIVRSIIDRNFDDFTAFSRMLIVRAGENDEQA